MVAITSNAFLRAQGPSSPADATFEVASVKPNKSGDPRVFNHNGAGGRFTVTNFPVLLLIMQAYQMQESHIVGGPAWITSDRFDIVAKAQGDVPPLQLGQMGPMNYMMQHLLADRFKLTVHRETRELPVYKLVLARSDGRLGPQLTRSTTDCQALIAGRGRADGPPSPPPATACGFAQGPGIIRGGGFPLSQLATALSNVVGRNVVDKTGLTGNYDLEMTYTPDPIPQGPLPGLPPIDPNGPSIFTAVQEQLGLKLDSQRGPVDVLVIDSVDHPTKD
jgi:uncharacterized protein (TIGR03435 family)